jgi:hypothetical protein
MLDPVMSVPNFGRDGKEAILCWLKDPPPIDITFVIIDPELRKDAAVTLKPPGGPEVQPEPLALDGQHLFKNLPAGQYEILVRSASHAVPTFTFGVQLLNQTSPDPWELDLNQANPNVAGGVL